MTADMAKGKLVALDVGLARIGVAVCDPLRLASRPLGIVHRRSRREDFACLARIVDEQEGVAVICGLPLAMDGAEGSQAKSMRKWGARLAQALRALLETPVPVVFWDERLSTFAAQNILTPDAYEDEEDAVAAAVILQSYLDAMARGEPERYGRIDLPPKNLST
jgi:putative Holliday junction resolvase